MSDLAFILTFAGVILALAALNGLFHWADSRAKRAFLRRLRQTKTRQTSCTIGVDI